MNSIFQIKIINILINFPSSVMSFSIDKKTIQASESFKNTIFSKSCLKIMISRMSTEQYLHLVNKYLRNNQSLRNINLSVALINSNLIFCHEIWLGIKDNCMKNIKYKTQQRPINIYYIPNPYLLNLVKSSKLHTNVRTYKIL